MADKGANHKDAQDNSKQSFLTFVCNRRTGEFCGRTAGSWAKILIFYVIFYACLAAFWAVMLIIFYQTIDYEEPKWQLEESRIGTNPGLGYRPRAPPSKVDSTLIWFKSKQSSTYQYALDDITSFFNESLASTSNNDVADSNQCIPGGDPLSGDKFCRFDIDKMRLSSTGCSETQDSYGYGVNEPCVLIKLNRIYGWKPINYKKDKVPEAIKDSWKENYIQIKCEGENPADKENIGEIEYYPKEGIPFIYFPFKNKPGYISPFVWVKFKKPGVGVIINVECKAYAANVVHDRMDREGSVHFELMID